MGHCNTCNSHGPVVIYIAKLFPKPDCSSFDAFGRVFSGSVKAGDKVRVLGQAYTPDDEEDSAVAQVSKVWVFMGRYRIPVTKGMAGTEFIHPHICVRRVSACWILDVQAHILGGGASCARRVMASYCAISILQAVPW